MAEAEAMKTITDIACLAAVAGRVFTLARFTLQEKITSGALTFTPIYLLHYSYRYILQSFKVSLSKVVFPIPFVHT